MFELIKLCITFLASTFRSHVALQAENLALRHQLGVYQRSIKRPASVSKSTGETFLVLANRADLQSQRT